MFLISVFIALLATQSGNCQQLSFGVMYPITRPALSSLSYESIAGFVIRGTDTAFVTELLPLRVFVHQKIEGRYDRVFSYGSLDTNLILSGHSFGDGNSTVFRGLQRNVLSTVAHSSVAEITLRSDAFPSFAIKSDTFTQVRTGSISVTSSASGHIVSGRQRGGVPVPAEGQFLIYQFDPTGIERKVGAINVPTTTWPDGPLAFAVFQDGSVLVSSASRFETGKKAQVWVSPFDRNLVQRGVARPYTEPEYSEVRFVAEKQPLGDTALFIACLRDPAKVAHLKLHWSSSAGDSLLTESLLLPSNKLFLPSVVMRSSDTWWIGGRLLTDTSKNPPSMACLIAVQVTDAKVRVRGFQLTSGEYGDCDNMWRDNLGALHAGGSSSDGMFLSLLDATVLSVESSDKTSSDKFDESTRIVSLQEFVRQFDGQLGSRLRLLSLDGREIVRDIEPASLLTLPLPPGLLVVIYSDGTPQLVFRD